MKKWLETDSFEVAFDKFNDNMEEIEQKLTEPLILENLIENGDFSQGTTAYTGSQATIAVVNGEGEISSTTDGGIAYGLTVNCTTSSANKYYVAYKIKPFRTHKPSFWGDRLIDTSTSATANISTLVSAIFTPTSDRENITLYGNGASPSELVVGSKVYFDNIILINLTSTFGVDNEPTKEEMDELMKVVPNGWWDGELTLEQKEVVQWLLKLVSEKADKQQEEWITPTLLNGATGTVQYMIDNFGFVHFRGRLLTIASGAAAFNLPIGYRLTRTTLFPVAGNIEGLLAVVNIGDGYQLKSMTNLSGAFYVDLSGISFKAER